MKNFLGCNQHQPLEALLVFERTHIVCLPDLRMLDLGGIADHESGYLLKPASQHRSWINRL
jgi:hypothetical protein